MVGGVLLLVLSLSAKAAYNQRFHRTQEKQWLVVVGQAVDLLWIAISLKESRRKEDWNEDDLTVSQCHLL